MKITFQFLTSIFKIQRHPSLYKRHYHSLNHIHRGWETYTLPSPIPYSKQKFKLRDSGANGCYKPNDPNRYLLNFSFSTRELPSSQHLVEHFPKHDLMFGHKSSLNRYMKTEITPSILLDLLR